MIPRVVSSDVLLGLFQRPARFAGATGRQTSGAYRDAIRGRLL